MSSEITYYGRGSLSRGDRRVVRRMAAQRNVELARIDSEAMLHAERAGAVGHVATRAMHEAALLTQIEVALSAAMPAAGPRLALIANSATVALAQVVANTVREVR